MHGIGRKIYRDDGIYEGEFQDDKLHGLARYITTKDYQKQFFGTFECDKRKEPGIREFQDGKK